MSTHKHIDRICLGATVLALLITVLFMNGAALGLTPVNNDDAGSGYFTANDLNGGWSTSEATKILLTGDGGKVTGGGAYLLNGDVHIIQAGKYVLSGALTNGSVIIDAAASDKIWLLLDGVSLHCEDSAAIVVEQAKKVFLTLADGTENTLSSGPAYSEETVAGGIDGTIYSRDDLTINGSGSLTVTAEYRHAIVCNDNLVMTGGTLDITAVQDGIHANDSARFANADITIRAGDDGITASNDDNTSYIYVESGSISIPACYEGIEAIDITIAGGVINIAPTDDGINANGRGGNSIIRITGGDITIINPTGRDADGLDSNGSIEISGGNIFISLTADGGNCALDCGTENGGTCTISGGTVIAAGSSSMAEGFDASSEQCFIMYNTSTAPAGTAVILKGGDGTALLSGALPCSFSSLVLSAPQLTIGETCTLVIGGTETKVTVDNTSASAGAFGMGGRGGAGGGHGRFDGTQDPSDNGSFSRPFGGGNSSPPEGEPSGDGSAGRPFGGGDFSPPNGNTDGNSSATPPAIGGGVTPPDGAAGSDSSASRPFGGKNFSPSGGDTGGDGFAARPFDGKNFSSPQNGTGSSNTEAPSTATAALLAVSALILALGLVVAFRSRR